MWLDWSSDPRTRRLLKMSCGIVVRDRRSVDPLSLLFQHPAKGGTDRTAPQLTVIAMASERPGIPTGRQAEPEPMAPRRREGCDDARARRTSTRIPAPADVIRGMARSRAEIAEQKDPQ